MAGVSEEGACACRLKAFRLDRTTPPSARLRNLLRSMLRMNAASHSPRRPLRGPHSFGKYGSPSLRAYRRTGAGALQLCEHTAHG